MRLRWYFGFFFLSGFCSLVYEVVWLRIAMAQFGVTTPLVSTVLSMFMAGLALGSRAAGSLTGRLDTGAAGQPVWRGFVLPLRLYALAELLVAASAFVVPAMLGLGHRLLLRAGDQTAWGSPRYYLASGSWIALTLLPFCVCMGATFPLAMAAIRVTAGEASRRSFSYLYVANVLGAACGTLTSAFVLVELLGFRGTLRVTALLNVGIGVTAMVLSGIGAGSSGAAVATAREASPPRGALRGPSVASPGAGLLVLLFTTGLVSMAMEVVWVRQFTPYLGTVVYAFATLLAVYLAATCLGSMTYRLASRGKASAGDATGIGHALVIAGLFGLLPLVAADPRLPLPLIDPANPQPHDLVVGGMRVALGLLLFCGAVGIITPMIVDRYSSGDPDRAGTAYSVNVLGCIVGPLLASLVLLPAVGERWSIAVLALLPFAAGPLVAERVKTGALAGAGLVALILLIATQDYAGLYPHCIVRRDYEATVIATDSNGQKELLVNGVGITALTPIAKMMVHLPMAFLGSPPRSALVLCFGMGTSFRSALSWGVPTTAVELVPSVPPLIGFYHVDGPRLLESPLARVVIDDARRFLERSPAQYDIITIDPPPPVEAAGSSFLYSREFYSLARARLRPGGILQQWFPGGEAVTLASVARSVTESFPHVRVFQSIEGWGFHFLASDSPIAEVSAATLARRLPAGAAADLVEWWQNVHPETAFGKVLEQEVAPERVVAVAAAPALEDDRPINEYFLLRRLLQAAQ
ncbi:MAG: hypothetical protein AUI47_00030 [Acidobacteria bacterium 13_1_40CM_2_68_5]|nr:MAG: hypothetical protein AUI47_00030 [Acidobacteria bacterium 13_1_40CM_2_68_5]